MVISQSEADRLLAMEKILDSNDNFQSEISVLARNKFSLVSSDKTENFFLDLYRSQINLIKSTLQNRARNSIILARVDFGTKHRNPDDAEIGSPHIHIYREGYHDKWAYELPITHFVNPENFNQTLHDFMRYCNINIPSNFRTGIRDD
ncbi:MAG: hypothetical protein QM537_00470 [Candidatus Symbiobacter sp.]|nr:hypothetical protein [Candidatus Symbiobacter sp.]